MTVVVVPRAIPTEQNRVRGVNRTSQRSTKNSIFKLGFITINIFCRPKLVKLIDQFWRQFVVRVQRENPRGSDLVDAKIPLGRMSIELTLEHCDVWMRSLCYCHGFVRAETIHQHDPLGPLQRSDCSPDVLALVAGEDKRSDCDHPEGRSPAMIMLFQSRGRRPAPRNCRLQKPDSRNSADKVRLLQNLICPPSDSGLTCASNAPKRAIERFLRYP